LGWRFCRYWAPAKRSLPIADIWIALANLARKAELGENRVCGPIGSNS
jgi:hypothetical protein